MPHYTILTNEDGTISQILRDGEPYDDGVSLEQHYAIVSTYFRIADGNLRAMRGVEDSQQQRFLGLQAFLMSLTGIEAFTNVFFQAYAEDLDSPELLARVSQRYGSLLARLRDCLALAFDQPLQDQDALLDRIQQLYRLRNQIVHPRWKPASLTVDGECQLVIHGLAQNFQAMFEDVEFCEEAYWWCVLLVARVARAVGNPLIEGFCFYWTGIYGLTEEALQERLGLADEGMAG